MIDVSAGLDYLHRLGGGTLQLGPGTFTLRNAVQLRQGVSLQGSGASVTTLRKAAGHCSKLSRDADWYENQVVVEDPSGFTVGCGIMIAGGVPDGALFGSTLVRTHTLHATDYFKSEFQLENSSLFNSKSSSSNRDHKQSRPKLDFHGCSEGLRAYLDQGHCHRD